MKIKLMVLGLFGLVASAGISLAGPAIRISVNPGINAPIRPICPPVAYCPPRYYGYPGVSFYPWGQSVVVASSGSSSFTTVSPVMNYANSAPVYRVPAPILPAQPVVVYPSSPFHWKR